MFMGPCSSLGAMIETPFQRTSVNRKIVPRGGRGSKLMLQGAKGCHYENSYKIGPLLATFLLTFVFLGLKRGFPRPCGI